MAFQFPGFQEPGFQGGETLPVGGAQATRQDRIPRWLVSFERVGKMTFLSDVGGDVLGTYYVPAIVDVSHSENIIDLERMSIPKVTCTVSVSPSSLKQHFIDLDEVGKAVVTVASWDGYTIRPVIRADMKELAEGFDGELISFRLTEEWAYNPIFPERLVNFDGFPASAIADGARFHTFTQAWGDAQQVPAFPVLDIGGGTQRWMIVGHNVPNLPTGGSGTPVRFKDALNATYIGADLGDPVSPYYNFSNSYGLDKAGDLLRNLIEKHSTYPDTLVDHAQLNLVYMYLNRFPIGGYIDQEGPIFDFIESRFQRQWLFVIYEQGGMLRGTAIDPTAPGVHTLVMNKHLLQLQEPVTEDKRYTHFKVRYRWRPKPPNPGWYGVSDIGAFNDEYLKQAQLLWGKNMFGDPVEFKRHAPAVDLADINDDATAIVIRDHYARLFHKGTRLKYLQLASAADIPLGTVVNLLDPERNQINKRAILIGRKWETAELLTHTFRTIEPYHLITVQGVAEPPPPPTPKCEFINVFGDFTAGGTWTLTEVGSTALHTKIPGLPGKIRLDKTTLVGAYDEIHIEQLLDNVTFGDCDFLRVTASYEMHMTDGAGIPQIAAAWFINGGVSLFEDDLTGWGGTPGMKSGILSFDLPNGGPGYIRQNSLTIWINGTCTGWVEWNITSWTLHDNP